MRILRVSDVSLSGILFYNTMNIINQLHLNALSLSRMINLSPSEQSFEIKTTNALTLFNVDSVSSVVISMFLKSRKFEDGYHHLLLSLSDE